jgi:hypothetical protein
MNCRYIAQTTAFFKSAVSHGDAQRNFSRKMWSTWLQLSIRRDNVFTCYEKNDPHESNNKRIVEKKKKSDPSPHKIKVIINREPQYILNKQNYI